MIDLEPLWLDFNDQFPNYIDDNYDPIIGMVDALQQEALNELVNAEEFDSFAACIEPVIAVKNYKSQIPFPLDFRQVIKRMMDIGGADVGEPPGDIEVLGEAFVDLIGTEGFELPTVAAVFHFSHPDHFPIVDRYITAACGELYANREDGEFNELNRPVLPAAGTSVENKMNHYKNFIGFFFEIQALQNDQHGHNYSIRDIDKALMVRGKAILDQ